MASNERGYGKRVVVTAAANRTSGTLVVEEGLHGVVTVTTASGEDYALNIEQREFEFAELSGVAKGDPVYIDGSNALTLTEAGNRVVGVCTEVAGGRGCPTGKMHVLLLPQMSGIATA